MYVYGCGVCGIEVQERRKISQMNDPLACPLCGENCSRSITVFSIGSGLKSEPTAHSPTHVAPKRDHRAGCSCCVPRAKKATTPEPTR